MAEKYLIFDSGPLINLTQNCLISVFRDLETIFQGEFLVTPGVIYETIQHPLQIKRFEWGSMRMQSLLDDEIIRPLEEEELVTNEELKAKTQEIMNKANNAFFSEGKPIHLIERGESECLALASILNEKNIKNAVVIDERTARMICENPEMLKELMESKLHAKLKVNEDNFKIFQKINVLRSTELMYTAFKRKLIDTDKRKLEAILYSLKFGGCSVSEREVEFMKNA